MMPNRVGDFLRQNQNRHLEQLFELLRIPSIANPGSGDGCDRAADWLVGCLQRIGCRAEIMPTAGRPCVFAQTDAAAGDAPTLLVYGHYDVQPADPLELWQTPPFEPVVRDGYVYARGANDDKGQLFTHLMALDAWQNAGGPPVNVKLLLEGEEEIGSPNLEPFIVEHADLLRADACVISDSEFFAPDLPSITYSLRGLAYFEITLTAAAADAHSGIHGGALQNVASVLASMVAEMHDSDGRVTLGGFYDDVLPLSDQERRSWEALPFDEAEYARSLGVEALTGGERGVAVLERRWARPTLDCNGLVSGYTAPGSKTIIPASAHAKISTRLVPNQDPHKVVESMRAFVASRLPVGVRADVQVNAEARPVLLNRDTPAMRAAEAALEAAFGRRPAFIRCGASVPVTEVIQRLLGLDAVLMGFGLGDDNLHSPNERFALNQLHRGAMASAAFMVGLAGRS